MKKIIKELLREGLLSERLTDVDSDVNLLYDMYFKEDIDYINKTGYVNGGLFKKNSTNTSILRTDESIKANELNPCDILVNNIFGNAYSPSSKSIMISANSDAVDFVINEFKGDLHSAINYLDEPNRSSLRNEFTEERIKGSIHHELAHWIDDTMNNQHIKKRTNKAMELGTRHIGGIPVNSTKMEIQGQIHNVKQLHNKLKDVWDDMSFTELISMSPSLTNISINLSGKIKDKWIRDLKTRMHREGLLGNNMVNY